MSTRHIEDMQSAPPVVVIATPCHCHGGNNLGSQTW